MEWLAQWLLIAAAIAIGWLLGRKSARDKSRNSETSLAPGLPAGVRFTFDRYSDEAIAKYVQALEVSRDTLAMHLSIASHFRKKGEVERAILIHQNILASPVLDSDNRERSTLELARDYMSAGLLDRAESLLKQLEGSRHWGTRSQLLLLEIFQDEKDWSQARQTALKLDHRRDPSVQKKLAHYCCEEAQEALKKGGAVELRRLLREALGFDRNCVRANLMLAQVYQSGGEYAEAITVLHRVEDQDIRFAPEVVPGLTHCYRQLSQEGKLNKHLQNMFQRSGSARVLIAWCESLRILEGDEAALALMAEQLDQHPSLLGLHHFVEWQTSKVATNTRSRLESIRQVTQKLLASKPQYVCENCGYSGRTLLWLCPSCKSWETTKPVQGIEGE